RALKEVPGTSVQLAKHRVSCCRRGRWPWREFEDGRGPLDAVVPELGAQLLDRSVGRLARRFDAGGVAGLTGRERAHETTSASRVLQDVERRLFDAPLLGRRRPLRCLVSDALEGGEEVEARRGRPRPEFGERVLLPLREV